MNYLAFIPDVRGWLLALDPITFRTLWIAIGVIGLAIWIYAAYRLARFALFHRRFRGTWYTPAQFQALVNILSEDQNSGRRVMQHDETKLLREWKLGKHYKGLGNDKRNEF